ncbi:MAG: hypothetical protein HRU41_17610 [Saprospiraceae bacterium]|nr:hypothetical protein [Saprospiraceae bacterium]
MDFQQFKQSLSNTQPPGEIGEELTALWYAGKDDWDRSHDIAQDIPNRNGDWIHAYLHRWEGDDWNASYWYRRAGKSKPSCSLAQEWENIVQTLLESGT